MNLQNILISFNNSKVYQISLPVLRKAEGEIDFFNSTLTTKMMGYRKSTNLNHQNKRFNFATFAKSHELINLLTTALTKRKCT